MDLDITCDDFQFENTSSSIGNGMSYPCNKSTKAKKGLRAENVALKCEQLPEAFMISTSNSSSSTLMSGLVPQNYSNCTVKEPLKEVPNISYNLAVAKSIMQQYSSISGDNLFDHLADIIKRVIDERPPNVIDFFEEFSRNVREQKFHLPERFPPEAVFEENRLYKMAKNQLISMKLPYPTNLTIQAEDDLEEERSRPDELSLDLKQEIYKFRTFNDRVQHLQFFWNQCGLSISSEDIYQLACSMDRLQNHPSIVKCRFWGMINGLKASYYIVEASLSKSECESRLLQMEKEIQENRLHAEDHRIPSHIGPELIPGAVGWENHPVEDILKMTPQVLPVPLVNSVETFDIPPEPIGRGVNRYSYFVVNSLSDEWIELPISTPRHILLSRCIKKFFTGDLEEDIVSYPCFFGKEKHYLRAMIARITSGTYIAPKNYYRKMTKREKHLFQGVQDSDSEDDEENDEEEEGQTQLGEEEQDEEQLADNDIVLIKNEKYDSSLPINTLNNSEEWVHVRPNILLQGRVVWYNQEKELRRLEKLRLQDEIGEDESHIGEDDESDDEEAEEQEQLQVQPELGPAILTSCAQDINSETPVPWIRRFTSQFTNRNERIMLMQSNVWPGACTFAYKDLCESIYLGWGHKAVARNMTWKHLNPIEKEYTHNVSDFLETTDPSLEMEQSYQLSLLLKDKQMQDEHEELESSDEDNDEETEDED